MYQQHFAALKGTDTKRRAAFFISYYNNAKMSEAKDLLTSTNGSTLFSKYEFATVLALGLCNILSHSSMVELATLFRVKTLFHETPSFTPWISETHKMISMILCVSEYVVKIYERAWNNCYHLSCCATHTSMKYMVSATVKISSSFQAMHSG